LERVEPNAFGDGNRETGALTFQTKAAKAKAKEGEGAVKASEDEKERLLRTALSWPTKRPASPPPSLPDNVRKTLTNAFCILPFLQSSKVT